LNIFPVRQTNPAPLSVSPHLLECPIAFSYSRFSCILQKKGESSRRQQEAAKEWCDRHGFILSNEQFNDEGRSAFKGKHLGADGDLKRFLSLVEAGRIKNGVLLVESFDRISRLPMTKSVSLFLQIINAGIGVVFTMTHDQKIITEQAIDNEPYILYSILGEAQRAHSESKHKSERVADACRKRKERAIAHGTKQLAWCPPWCDFDKEKGYIVNEERANIVRRIYKEYLSGNGAFRISRLFNGEKVPTLGHRGFKTYINTTREWYKKTVRDFLFDRRVFGYAHHLNKDGYYPTIIPKSTFDKVQSRLALRSNSKPTGGQTDGVGNLFTSICRCSVCNGVMSKSMTRKTYKHKTTKYEYLVCDGARGGTHCSYKSIPYEFIEDTFFRVLAMKDGWGASIISFKEHERLASLQKELAGITKQIEKLTGLVLNDDNPSVTLTTKLKEFEGKRATVNKAITLIQSQIQITEALPSDLTEIKKGISTSAKDTTFRLKLREYIRNTIEKIVLDVHSPFKNYQIHFKGGQLPLSVVMNKIGKEDSQGVAFQVLTGTKKAFDTDATIFESKTGKIL
jgi:DNA invertase Pin-like site-specific DNA recombinase